MMDGAAPAPARTALQPETPLQPLLAGRCQLPRSDRVAGAGCFGASLMLQPELVARCMAAIGGAVDGTPVNVKCRLGVDEVDSYAQLSEFVKVTRAHPWVMERMPACQGRRCHAHLWLERALWWRHATCEARAWAP